jgi:hypothetical protein
MFLGLVVVLSLGWAQAASAANGDQLRQIIADRSGTACASTDPQGDTNAVGTGVAFDGTSLLMSCWYDAYIVAVNPADGSQVTKHLITGGPSGYGAIAWDNGRHLLWACDTGGTVYKIDLSTNTSTFAFSVPGCTDGLAYDASDDTLWTSPDATGSVTHTMSNGTFISVNSVALPNSGIAVGGPLLYLGADGNQQIYTSPKDFSSPPTLFASFPRRIEDLECDNVTFASSGKGAIWSNDAYDNILNAWEIPAGSCSFGGGVTDKVAPTCALTAMIAGPPKKIQVTVQDTDSGIASIVVTTSANANTPVPAFTVGATTAVMIEATKVDQSLSSSVAITVTDVAGNVTTCDPLWPGTKAKKAAKLTARVNVRYHRLGRQLAR